MLIFLSMLGDYRSKILVNDMNDYEEDDKVKGKYRGQIANKRASLNF